MKKGKRGKKQEKTKKIRNRFIFILILLAIVVAGVYFGYVIEKNGGGFKGVLITALGQDTEKLENLDTINILLLRNK